MPSIQQTPRQTSERQITGSRIERLFVPNYSSPADFWRAKSDSQTTWYAQCTTLRHMAMGKRKRKRNRWIYRRAREYGKRPGPMAGR